MKRESLKSLSNLLHVRAEGLECLPNLPYPSFSEFGSYNQTPIPCLPSLLFSELIPIKYTHNLLNLLLKHEDCHFKLEIFACTGSVKIVNAYWRRGREGIKGVEPISKTEMLIRQSNANLDKKILFGMNNSFRARTQENADKG